ncbi:MAG: DNA (cytosine-5-)-methyltransferase [Phycisphaerales bacterium]
MPDFLSQTERRELMTRVRSQGTGPERALWAALRRRGVRPSTNSPRLPGKPDVVFHKARLAVFVDGEKWHGGQWRRRGLATLDGAYAGAERRAYWVRKIQSNVSRDLRWTGALLAEGWSVLRLWDRDVEKDAEACADLVLRARDGGLRPDRMASAAALGTSADFFAGIGLMRLGLEAGGWRTVWANDYDATKRRLYYHNLGDERIGFTLESRSIHDVGPKSVPRVGLIAACFPCTDLSLAGKQRGIEVGPQSSAYLRFADMLAKMGGARPPFVILENVLGLITAHEGRDFQICLRLLGEAGYRFDAVAVNACRFVPQSRPRLFVVGVRREIDIPPTIDAGEAEVSTLRPARLVEFIRANADLPWAIRPMPEPPELTTFLPDILEDLPFDDPRWWSTERVKKLRAQTSERHRRGLDALAAKRGVAWATGFRRMRKGTSTAELRMDGIAGCLRTPKGGSAKQILVRADADGWRARLLTPRECARLMGAPDFRFDAEGVRDDDALFGFGDAVVVDVVNWVVRNAVNPLAAELIRGRLLRAP